jgi:hypothetical protein
VNDLEHERGAMASRAKFDKLVQKLTVSCTKRDAECTNMDGRASEIRKMMKELDRDLNRKHGKEEELSHVQINVKTIEHAIKDLNVCRRLVWERMQQQQHGV